MQVFFFLGASAGDCNDPGEGGQEGGRGWGWGGRDGEWGNGEGEMGRGGNGEGETGMGKRGGVEVLARVGVGRDRRGGLD